MTQTKRSTSTASTKSEVPSQVIVGIAVSPGIQIAKVHIHDPVRASAPRRLIREDEVEAEIKRLDEAIHAARDSIRELRDKVSQTIDETHASIFDPQLMILEDPEIIEQTTERIRKQHENASMALMTVIRKFTDQFASVSDPYIASRKADIEDVGNRVCQMMDKRPTQQSPVTFTEEVIVLASDLSPSDTAQMDQKHVMGFATELGGPTSHTAILAKALEIPAAVALGSFMNQIKPGTMAIIDGYEGTLTLNPTQREIARARTRKRRHLVHERDLQKLRNLPAETIDGYQVELAANVELPIEIPHVLAHGAHGVGLFRTEFQYLESKALPSEDDLFKVYKKVLEDVAPYPVIFRTIDLGGDKFLSTLNTGRELNPFLGLRAIRLCLAHPEVFRVQLRAILRASAFGRARIMFPMIANITEVIKAKKILKDVIEELRADQIKFDEAIPVGIMIEIPSAALCAEQLAREVDFFSIGTNDLIQYTLAVDRGNEQVAQLYDPFHPAILFLLRRTIEAAQREGIWVGLCGEMSANPLCALMLIGLGINELSMGALAIPEIKRLIRQIRLADARKIVEDLYSARDSREIHDYVRNAYQVIQRRRRGKATAAKSDADS